MAKITLENNSTILIDDDDISLLYKFKWHSCKARGKTYLRTTIYKPKKQDLYLHTLIVGSRKVGHTFYFVDGNSLNLQKDNIIQIPHFTSRHLVASGYPKKTSIYRGVHLNGGKYVAQISFKKKLEYIGRFQNEVHAAISYDLKALELHKEFAKTNIIANPYK